MNVGVDCSVSIHHALGKEIYNFSNRPYDIFSIASLNLSGNAGVNDS